MSLHKRIYGYAVGVATALALLIVASAVFLLDEGPSAGAAPEAIDAFLANHWRDPLHAQGSPPASFSEQEASLDPAACGQCHPRQHEDWRQSLHSQTMGPGILWQFHLMDQVQANRCMRCHAPLAEQKALIALDRKWPLAPKAPPPSYVPSTLGYQGLVCAGCHVRGHERFGPPARTRSVNDSGSTPHGGFNETDAFGDSRFCAVCHQFPEDGPRLNGKLQEDTYAQWRASRFGQANQSCQSCHMPDRRHAWHGVHTPDMVRKALDVSLHLIRAGGGRAEVRALIRNTGAGHHFPTYMVPKITATLNLVDPAGVKRSELARHVIGWKVDVALTQEEFDTRIPAGEALEVSGFVELPQEAGWRVELLLEVAPREHYERMFQGMLAQAAQLEQETVALLRKAHEEAKATRFEALRLTEPLPVEARNGSRK